MLKYIVFSFYTRQKVIELLCSFGADVNYINHNGMSALSLLLDCAQKRELISTEHDGNMFATPTHSAASQPLPPQPSSSSSSLASTIASTTSGATVSHSGRNFWVPVAYLLLEKGALWNKTDIVDIVNGRNQLHLLFSGPIPPSRDINKFISILRHALLVTDSDSEGGGGGGGVHGNKFDVNLKDRHGNTVFELARLRHENSYEYDVIYDILHSHEYV
jgi:hypothetical protein